MARLVHAITGVTVNVSDEKVARLSSEWNSADKSEEKPATRRKASADSETSK